MSNELQTQRNLHEAKLIQDAISTAMLWHGLTLDKGGKLYVLHPLRVMLSLNEFVDPTVEQMCAAVMHDLLEDTEYPRAHLLSAFGEEVYRIVDSLTRITFPDGKKEPYTDFIDRALSNPWAVAIKAADIQDNTSPERLGCLPEKERNFLVEKYKTVYPKVFTALRKCPNYKKENSCI